jgi:hypothetical protein
MGRRFVGARAARWFMGAGCEIWAGSCSLQVRNELPLLQLRIPIGTDTAVIREYLKEVSMLNLDNLIIEFDKGLRTTYFGCRLCIDNVNLVDRM